MALDQGTSSSRAIIYDAHGTVVASAQQPFDMILPAEGWVEQDPEVLWQSILDVGREAIASAAIEPQQIACIGITNQRETTLVWDRVTGDCVYNAIVWQDSRTADLCAELRERDRDGEPLPQWIQNKTGLVVDPYFSATKLSWILDREDLRSRAEAGELAFGTVDTYLVWRLTGGAAHRTDISNASRTLLLDIHTQNWDAELLELFAVPEPILPEVCDNAFHFGTTEAEWFGAPIPITGIAGDQQSALIGQGCFAPGQTKSTYGTGCFVMANTGGFAVKSHQQLLTTVAYRVGGEITYALEGSIFVAGVAIKWLRDQMGLIDSAEETSAAFERCQGDTHGVYVVPAFTGLGAPHWQANARALITGLTLDSHRDHVVTAFLQSVVFQTAELKDAMIADGASVEELRVDGGMVVNDRLCQFLADILGVKVLRPQDVETTALGAAILAGVGAGHFADLHAASAAWQLDREFLPEMAASERERRLQGYAKAEQQVLAGVT